MQEKPDGFAIVAAMLTPVEGMMSSEASAIEEVRRAGEQLARAFNHYDEWRAKLAENANIHLDADFEPHVTAALSAWRRETIEAPV